MDSAESNNRCVTPSCDAFHIPTRLSVCDVCGNLTQPLGATASFEAISRNEDDDESELQLQPFETPNPWLRRVFSLPAYGKTPAGAVQALRRVSPDPEEIVVAGLRASHNGRSRRGYLIATTTLLRWVQTFPTASDDFWDYGLKVEVTASGILQLGPGDLFQVRWGTAKRFRELHAAMQQAVLWEADNATPQVAVVETVRANGAASSIADELGKLASLRERGLLTDEEFSAAKRSLLGT
jgi:hypothetical protein